MLSPTKFSVRYLSQNLPSPPRTVLIFLEWVTTEISKVRILTYNCNYGTLPFLLEKHLQNLNVWPLFFNIMVSSFYFPGGTPNFHTYFYLFRKFWQDKNIIKLKLKPTLDENKKIPCLRIFKCQISLNSVVYVIIINISDESRWSNLKNNRSTNLKCYLSLKASANV